MAKMESTVRRRRLLHENQQNLWLFLLASGEIAYKDCSTFNDMSGPAMINTFNDINKLVQARKLNLWTHSSHDSCVTEALSTFNNSWKLRGKLELMIIISLVWSLPNNITKNVFNLNPLRDISNSSVRSCLRLEDKGRLTGRMKSCSFFSHGPFFRLARIYRFAREAT